MTDTRNYNSRSSCTSSNNDSESEYESYNSESSLDEDTAGQIQAYMLEPRRTVPVVAENEDEAMAAEQENENCLGNLDW